MPVRAENNQIYPERSCLDEKANELGQERQQFEDNTINFLKMEEML